MTATASTFHARNNVRLPVRIRSASMREAVTDCFEELLLDSDFDRIGELVEDGGDFSFYRELGALPERYR